MTQTTYTIAAVAAVLAVVLLVTRLVTLLKYRSYRTDLVFPDAPPRPDLHYGYYACNSGQVVEVADHVTLHMESQFEGQDKAIENIVGMARTTILDLSAQLFWKPNGAEFYSLRLSASLDVFNFLSRLQVSGALRYVEYLYPIDEPNNTVGDIAVLRSAVNIVRDCAAQFPELAGVKLAVIYAADKEFIGQEMYSLIGFDDYDLGSHVLVSDRYKRLKQSLLPGQKTIIVPGGVYGQHPGPFVKFANANPEVGLVMPFIWYDPTGNVKEPGIRSSALRDEYVKAGRQVKSPLNTAGSAP